MKKTIIAATLIATALLLVSCGGKGKKAKGADGHVYHIRKDVNLLRGYTESTNNNNSGSGY